MTIPGLIKDLVNATFSIEYLYPKHEFETTFAEGDIPEIIETMHRELLHEWARMQENLSYITDPAARENEVFECRMEYIGYCWNLLIKNDETEHFYSLFTDRCTEIYNVYFNDN